MKGLMCEAGNREVSRKGASMSRTCRAILTIGLGEEAGRGAYLAGFHAAQALIFERTGKSAKTHQGVQARFLKLAKDESAFPSDLLPFLSRAYNLKAVADYETGPNAVVPLDRAAEAIRIGELFIVGVEQLLSTAE
jgi:uncharacterized protein (UPF0332 family)